MVKSREREDAVVVCGQWCSVERVVRPGRQILALRSWQDERLHAVVCQTLCELFKQRTTCPHRRSLASRLRTSKLYFFIRKSSAQLVTSLGMRMNLTTCTHRHALNTNQTLPHTRYTHSRSSVIASHPLPHMGTYLLGTQVCAWATEWNWIRMRRS